MRVGEGGGVGLVGCDLRRRGGWGVEVVSGEEGDDENGGGGGEGEGGGEETIRNMPSGARAPLGMAHGQGVFDSCVQLGRGRDGGEGAEFLFEIVRHF